MRILLAAPLALCAATCNADRLMFMPTATKIRAREVRTELVLDRTSRNDFRAFLGVGLTPEFELEFQLNRFEPRSDLATFNFSYNYVPSIVDTSPGISLGVRDAMNRTPEGRLVYVATTYRMGLEGDWQSNSPLELTIGVGVGRRRQGVFTGVMLPFTWQFRMMAEFDLDRVMGGLEYQPFHGAAVRLMFQERRTLVGLRWTARF